MSTAAQRTLLPQALPPGPMAGAPAAGPQSTAVALAYEEGAFAPRVVAKGRGSLAREILRRAGEAGVYVHQSPELVGLLMRVDLDEHIPPELYLAIAELLAWLYRIDQKGTRP